MANQISAPKVTVIAPIAREKAKLRVAAYARVSSDSADQLNSYLAQVDYYTRCIGEDPDWDLVDIYADEGISGLDFHKRDEFNRMLADCRAGKIDRVLVKSVSRFCRNTLDGLEYVRRLKRCGVGVYFEKENTNTLYMPNEMILTFMMSQAQAGSESLSTNVKWGFRKRFADGVVYYHYDTLLGYRRGPDDEPEIDPAEAPVVRRINRLEHGKRICKHSATLEEPELHAAVTSAMNDLFRQRTAREVLAQCVAAALAGTGNGGLTLPDLETRLLALQTEQLDLLQLAMQDPNCTEYDERLTQINDAMSGLLTRKNELIQAGHTDTGYGSRVQAITDTLEGTVSAIEEFETASYSRRSAASRCWIRTGCASASRTGRSWSKP